MKNGDFFAEAVEDIFAAESGARDVAHPFAAFGRLPGGQAAA
jgi:hypothetical protein